jgi:hypothetical protein
MICHVVLFRRFDGKPMNQVLQIEKAQVTNGIQGKYKWYTGTFLKHKKCSQNFLTI